MARVVDLPTRSDDRGNLTVIDNLLPFAIRRVYYLHGTTGKARGGHRHRKNTQGLVCVHGRCVVEWSNGSEHDSVLLDRPDRLLLLQPEDWHLMHSFSPDAVLLVLASEHYDSRDYISEGYDT